MNASQIDAVIVGGGIAGLAAAWRLRHRDVLLLEADTRVGGRICSEPRGAYWLNWARPRVRRTRIGDRPAPG